VAEAKQSASSFDQAMHFDGHRWISVDGQWQWNGSRWRKRRLALVLDAFSPRPAPRGIQIVRGVLVCQASGIGCAAAFLLTIAGIATLAAAWLTVGAMVGIALIGLAITGGFVLLAVRLIRVRSWWTIAVLALQAGLAAVGIPLYALASYTGAHAGAGGPVPGTDGPFADGGNAIALLTSLAFVGGAALTPVAFLFEEMRRLVEWPLRQNRQ
jgi:hypothetical protein